MGYAIALPSWKIEAWREAKRLWYHLDVTSRKKAKELLSLMGLEDRMPPRILYPQLSKMSILTPGRASPSASPSGDGGISDDFSGTLANWTQGDSYASIVSGQLQVAGEGGIRHNTSLGTGDKWIRCQIPTVTSAATVIIFGSDASGNFGGPYIINNAGVGSNEWALHHAAHYHTYTTWVGDETTSQMDTGVIYNAAHYIGLTFDKDLKVVRLWANITNTTPDSLTSWDSGAAQASIDFSTTEFDGDYVGFAHASGSGSSTFDNFSAGDL